jgi:hypothetical protein
LARYRKLKRLAADNVAAAETLYLAIKDAGAAGKAVEMLTLKTQVRRLIASVGVSDTWLRRLLAQSSHLATFDQGGIAQVYEIASKGLRRKPNGPQVPSHQGGLSKKDCLALLKFCVYFLPGLRSSKELVPNPTAVKEGGSRD